MCKNGLFYSFVLAALLLIGTNSMAQSGLVQSSEIIKKATNELGEANRSYEKITEFPPVQPDPVITYEPGEVILSLPRMDSKTKVVPIKAEPPKAPGLGYVKLGTGNYAATYLDAFISGRNASKVSYFAHLRHRAYGNGPTEFARMSDNLAEAGISYNYKKVVGAFKLDYNRFRYNYYGFDESVEDIEEDSIKLVFAQIHGALEIKNRLESDKLNYRGALEYFHTGNSDWKESEFLLPITATYRLDTLSKVGLDVSMSFISHQDSLTRSRQLIAVTPFYQRTTEKYKIKGGLSFQYTSDTLNDVKGLHLYPSIYAEYFMIPQTASVFAEFGGGIVKNNLRQTLNILPYLERDVHLANSNRKMEIAIGIRNRIKSNLHLTVKGLYGLESNFMVLTNGPDSSRFVPVYDPGKVTYTGLDLGVQLQVSQAYQAAIQTSWRSYQTDTLEYAWHRPGAHLQFRNKFNLRQKLYFTADFYYISNLRGYNLSTFTSVKLKDIADLNLGAEYRFSNAFSAFLSVNNVLGRKYERYLNYPNNGFNLLGGLTYNF